jgi:hypothetical protein
MAFVVMTLLITGCGETTGQSAASSTTSAGVGGSGAAAMTASGALTGGMGSLVPMTALLRIFHLDRWGQEQVARGPTFSWCTGC